MGHIEGIKGNKTNRLGCVLVNGELLYGLTRMQYATIFEDVTILDIEYYDEDTAKFVCESKHFARVPLYDAVPFYVVTVERKDSGETVRVGFVNVGVQ